ncbi:MAG: hypothetical protein AABY84_09935 [Candidatus Firestonebacteria bacterium]
MDEKKIVYTQHLQLRIKFREIDNELPYKIYRTSTEKYFDYNTNYYIAVSNVHYKGKMREMAIVYEETINEIKIITMHPLKLYEKMNRINRGRWRKI